MAGVEKYNYSAALELLINAHKNGAKVTYQEMQTTLGLERPIEDRSAASTNNSILYELRNRLRSEYGLVFKSAANGTHSGPDYYYYIISEVKGSNITKKDTKSIKKSDVKEQNYEALSRDNQKLYAEVQRLELENRRLLEMVSEVGSKEEDYKNIIQSLMNLAGIS
jgi:hypothetical protein